ncbi:MAG: methyltransferase domain-containing protein, partial [Desulfobulbaceae bacterium]|nr:methyltransferase domain-containing protein [Desulfobulbaceae bacterium]
MASSVLDVSSLDADGLADLGHLSSPPSRPRNRLRLALPGERLRAVQVGDFFLPEEIIAAHPGRVSAPCPYFGRCGGCDLQHANYRLQLALKGQMLRGLFAASQETETRAMAERIPVVLPSPRTFGYRQRLRLLVSERGLAFRGFHSRQSVTIGHCLLARPEITAALAAIAASKDFNTVLELAEEVEFLLNPDLNKVDLLIRLTRPSRPAGRACARRFLEMTPALGRIFFYGENFSRESPICRDGVADDEPLSLTYPPSATLPQGAVLRWPVGGFSQVNIEQNHALLQRVVSWAALGKDDSVLELFCGSGNFSMPLARRAKSLVGVEGQGAAIRQARDNARLAGLDNCRFEKAKVHDFCRALAAGGERFSFILLDPPRAGAPGLAGAIRRLCDGRLLIISCDPISLV